MEKNFVGAIAKTEIFPLSFSGEYRITQGVRVIDKSEEHYQWSAIAQRSLTIPATVIAIIVRGPLTFAIRNWDIF